MRPTEGGNCTEYDQEIYLEKENDEKMRRYMCRTKMMKR